MSTEPTRAFSDPEPESELAAMLRSAEENIGLPIVFASDAEPKQPDPSQLTPVSQGQAEAPAPVPVQGETPNPLAKAVCLAVSFSSFGISRKADKSKVQAGADMDMLKVNKLLLDSPEYEAIRSFDNEILAFIKARCQPSLFRRGVYLVATGFVVRLNDKLKEFQAKRQALVEAFLAVYDQQREEAKTRLGDQWNVLDYPPKDQLARRFGMSWNFLKFGTPDELNEIDPEIAREEQNKLIAQMREAGEELKVMLRAEALKKISHLVDRLTDTEDGKKKILRSSAIANVEEFLEFFDLRNINSDDELNSLIKTAREAMTGVDRKALTSNDAVRDAVKKQLSDVTAKLDAMVVSANTRAISFDDEE